MTRMRTTRATLAIALGAAMAACGESGGNLSVCASRGDITGPAYGERPRFHDAVTTDSAWRERIVEEVADFRADTTVRVLFVHRTAPTAADRERVTAGGGSILSEVGQFNGIHASFGVAGLRTYAPTVPLERVIDAHLVGADGLPICE